jgi:antitoxin VapB
MAGVHCVKGKIMAQVAKLFFNGRSQAVRLPSAYRFDCKEVYIRQDTVTGDVILSRKPGSWNDFFKLADTVGVPSDFMTDRQDGPAQERNLL